LAQGAFGGGVRWDGETSLESEEGTEIDNFSATKGYHVLAGSLGEKPYRLEVNVNDLEKRSGKEIRRCGVIHDAANCKKERLAQMAKVDTYIIPVILGEI
jgi:hypothetical protein